MGAGGLKPGYDICEAGVEIELHFPPSWFGLRESRLLPGVILRRKSGFSILGPAIFAWQTPGDGVL